MAGSGKGVLRVAIEDFLETFDLGKLLGKWFVEWGEEQEDSILDSFANVSSEIESIPGYPNELKFTQKRSGKARLQGGIASIIGFGSQLGMSAASGFMSPFIRLINYAVDKKVQSARFDPSAAVTIIRRNPLLANVVLQDIKDMGWSDDRLSAWQTLLTPLLNENDYLVLWLRKELDDAQLLDKLQVLGYQSLDVEFLKKLKQVIPNVTDLVSFAVREAFNDDIAKRFEYDNDFPESIVEWGEKQGLSRFWLSKYWRAHWSLPSPTQGFEMLHRLRPGVSKNPFTVDDLQTLLKTADYPTFFRSRLIDISYAPFTRVDVRRMYKVGVLDETGVIEAYKDLGYDDAKAKKLADFTVKLETGDDDTQKDKEKTLSIALIREALRKNLIDSGRANTMLSEYLPLESDREIVIKATLFQKEVDSKPDYITEYNRELKSAIEKSYTARMTTRDEAVTMMTSINIPIEEIELFLSLADFIYGENAQNQSIKLIGDAYTSRAIDYNTAVIKLGAINITGLQQTQLFNEWDNARSLPIRRLTEAQYRKAFKLELITFEDYVENIRGLGYTEKDITILGDMAKGGVEE